jgi:outer membrane protein OmpA-like peptidoglycan-associated protein
MRFSSLFRALSLFFWVALSAVSEARAAGTPPVHIFLGSDLGWGSVSPIRAPEGERNGLQFDLKGMGSVYFKRNWIFDLGGGWMFSKRSGENTNGGFTKVITRGAFLETSLRYGNFSGWQIGPVLQAILVGDVGLGNGQLVQAQAQKANLAGLQVFYEWPRSGHRMRVGGRWMTDLNIADRTVQVFQAGFEIGWPVAPAANSDRGRFVRRPGLQVIQKDRALKRVRLVLDARRIEFDYDQATLRPEAAESLARLGKFLANAHENWETVRISGHTDERGSVAYNQKLSENRAAAVKTAFIREGVPREKMTTRGFSELQPLDLGHHELAWQKNRRVEFEFTGVQDLDLIVDGVNQATDVDSDE